MEKKLTKSHGKKVSQIKVKSNLNTCSIPQKIVVNYHLVVLLWPAIAHRQWLHKRELK